MYIRVYACVYVCMSVFVSVCELQVLLHNVLRLEGTTNVDRTM